MEVVVPEFVIVPVPSELQVFVVILVLVVTTGVTTTPVTVGFLILGRFIVVLVLAGPQDTRVAREAIITSGRVIFFMEWYFIG